ncbi:MAG: protein rep [Actinomycetes bacterium]
MTQIEAKSDKVFDQKRYGLLSDVSTAGTGGAGGAHRPQAKRGRSATAPRHPNTKGIDIDIAPRAQGIALGIYAKTAAILAETPKKTAENVKIQALPNSGLRLTYTDPETGETIVKECRTKNGGFTVVKDYTETRAERWYLKSFVNRWLPGSRTAKCMRWRVPGCDVQVFNSVEHERAFYAGLQVCASVWQCPVCWAKISERRRAELVGIVESAKALGMSVYMFTVTIPHGMGDDVKTLLASMNDAWRATTSNRAGKEFRASLGLVGTVRTLEATYGENGFHPHFHVLFFTQGSQDPDSMKARFLPIWQKACVKHGLGVPSEAHGVTVQDGSYAAAYVSKWGIESEMTKGHLKTGREGSMSPMDLLRAGVAGDDRLKRLWLVYAAAFKGMRQLVYSPGLKALLMPSVGDLTDEELAAQQDDPSAAYFATIPPEAWTAIYRTGNESALLTIVEKCPDKLQDFISSCVQQAKDAKCEPLPS